MLHYLLLHTRCRICNYYYCTIIRHFFVFYNFISSSNHEIFGNRKKVAYHVNAAMYPLYRSYQFFRAQYCSRPTHRPITRPPLRPSLRAESVLLNHTRPPLHRHTPPPSIRRCPKYLLPQRWIPFLCSFVFMAFQLLRDLD